MPRGSMGVFAAAFAAVFGSPATAAGLTVTVLDGNAAVPQARVCVGFSSNRSAIGSALTSAAGTASFASSPAPPFLVTASLGERGAELAVAPAGAPPSITLRLAAGGPKCTGVSIQPLPTVNLPGTGGSVVVPTSIVLKDTPVFRQPQFSPIVLNRKREFCFGALGAGCGGAQFDIPVLALCSFGSCSINSGSWLHDECCSRDPHGMACQYGPLDAITGNDGNCVAEWNRALSRLPDYTWRRDVDFNKPNATGLVVFADYCARAGSPIHKDDVARFCCSGQGRALQVVSKFADPNLRICN